LSSLFDICSIEVMDVSRFTLGIADNGLL
jgi:hypothetical protein